MNHVSDNTPGTTWKYPEVPQSTQKYLKVSRSTSKYPEVPEHHLVWSSQFRAVCNSSKQFWTLRAICRDGMGLVIPEQPAYKSHRRAVLIKKWKGKALISVCPLSTIRPKPGLLSTSFSPFWKVYIRFVEQTPFSRTVDRNIGSLFLVKHFHAQLNQG